MKQEKQFSKKLNQYQQRELTKVLESTKQRKRVELDNKLYEEVIKAQDKYIASNKRVHTLLKTINKAAKELNKIIDNTRLDVKGYISDANVRVEYDDYKYSNKEHAPEVKRAMDTKVAKLEEFDQNFLDLRMRIIVGDLTFQEMQEMIDEKLASL